MAKAKGDHPSLEDKDHALWSRAMRGTTPLKRQKPPSKPESAPGGRRATAVGEDRRPAAVSSGKKAGPGGTQPPLPELAPGAAAGVDRSTTDKLRRGGFPIEGRLDLHGHTQEEAHAALVSFVENAHLSGKRCLIVITGKGGVGRQSGVLRGAVPRWLNSEPMRRRILAFASAQPKHGGGGALYVLLRRQR
ncbi:MAG TPA: Smr/MutS family protein [Alphaproteobacteria bacterium]|nr:Smr/MutS family protein [Alphaproteobacteria bacterium]